MNIIQLIENYCYIKDKNTGEQKKIKLSEMQKQIIYKLKNTWN